MKQQDDTGTPRPSHILDTIALGSILVFASVMPPLTSEPAADEQPPDGMTPPGDAPSDRARPGPAVPAAG